MDIKDRLVEILKIRSAGVFLFLGSGFSRRYLGLENWEGLLRKFCLTDRPFEYYRSSADSKLPIVARLLAEDFHDLWWKTPKYEANREKYKHALIHKTSPLRIEICEYLNNINESLLNFQEHQEELNILKELELKVR